MYQEIISMVRALVGYEYLYFDTDLFIKLTPHTWPISIGGVCVSPHDEIYLLDNGNRWHKLEATDMNYDKVLPTLYQRLKTITKQFKTVA